jgi:hypothetical protein
MRIFLRLMLLAATCALALSGCSKKADVKFNVTELQQSLSNTVTQLPAQPQPNARNPAAPNDANGLLQSALSAAQANDYAGSVIALQAAQQKPGLTADQVANAQRLKQAMVADLQRRAVNGDQAALAQLKAIEKTRSQ